MSTTNHITPTETTIDADPGLVLIAEAATASAATRAAEIEALCKTVVDNLHDVLDCRDVRNAQPHNGNLEYTDALAHLVKTLIVAIDGSENIVAEIGEYLF